MVPISAKSTVLVLSSKLRRIKAISGGMFFATFFLSVLLTAPLAAPEAREAKLVRAKLGSNVRNSPIHSFPYHTQHYIIQTAA